MSLYEVEENLDGILALYKKHFEPKVSKILLDLFENVKQRYIDECSHRVGFTFRGNPQALERSISKRYVELKTFHSLNKTTDEEKRRIWYQTIEVFVKWVHGESETWEPNDFRNKIRQELMDLFLTKEEQNQIEYREFSVNQTNLDQLETLPEVQSKVTWDGKSFFCRKNRQNLPIKIDKFRKRLDHYFVRWARSLEMGKSMPFVTEDPLKQAKSVEALCKQIESFRNKKDVREFFKKSWGSDRDIEKIFETDDENGIKINLSKEDLEIIPKD